MSSCRATNAKAQREFLQKSLRDVINSLNGPRALERRCLTGQISRQVCDAESYKLFERGEWHHRSFVEAKLLTLSLAIEPAQAGLTPHRQHQIAAFKAAQLVARLLESGMDQASAVGLGIEATWQASRVGKKAPPGGLRDRRKTWGRQVRLEIAAVARTRIVGPTALGSTDAGLLEDRPLSGSLGLAPRRRPVR